MSKNYASPGSRTNSLKKQKSTIESAEESPTSTTAKTSDSIQIHENFVLMSTPDKFKDKPEADSSVPELQIKNNDCFLLADMTRACVPQHLENLLQHYDSLPLTQAELLFLLIYIVALESGFAGATEYIQSKRVLHSLSSSSSYHSKNVLHLSRQQPTYTRNDDGTCFTLKLHAITDLEETLSETTTSLLVGLVTGDLMIVTLSPPAATKAKGFSLAMSVGRYVLSVQRKKNLLHHGFSKLDELTLELRDKLFVPMRNQHMNWLNAGVYPSLQSMPPELYEEILKYLNMNELKILANVCKLLYDVTRQDKRLSSPT